MSFQQITQKIRGDSPGRITEFTYYKVGVLGDSSAPKVYLQAALHADEQPGDLGVTSFAGFVERSRQ